MASSDHVNPGLLVSPPMQVPNTGPKDEEPDGLDEAICPTGQQQALQLLFGSMLLGSVSKHHCAHPSTQLTPFTVLLLPEQT